MYVRLMTSGNSARRSFSVIGLQIVMEGFTVKIVHDFAEASLFPDKDNNLCDRVYNK